MSKNEKLPENIKLEMIGEKRYVRISEGAKRYSVSPNTFRMMAAEAHAIIHVRRIVLIDTKMIDEKDHVFIMINPAEIGAELNWSKSDVGTATDELEKFGLAQIADKAEKDENMKLYLKRFV